MQLTFTLSILDCIAQNSSTTVVPSSQLRCQCLQQVQSYRSDSVVTSTQSDLEPADASPRRKRTQTMEATASIYMQQSKGIILDIRNKGRKGLSEADSSLWDK
ncbi:hypothetical protein MUK42_11737 [Musa troglodytarum]|uniref:Uncharacterized protein n=1 Tax=Musa troglodytarum TaxID=320322 RepID=A0A9E7GSK3_9LILI|nr:hypothetical protein MUK42_11737 [Musa troglodytarum]